MGKVIVPKKDVFFFYLLVIFTQMCALETPVKMATAFLRLHQHTSVSARRGGLELIVTYVSGSLFYKVQRALHSFDA